MKNKKSSVYQLTVCALMAAVMCVIGPMSIPIGAVPVSFTNFVICLTTCLLGWKWGSVSVIVYVLLGTFATAIASTGLADMASKKLSQIMGGKSASIVVLILAAVACLSQNLIPVHIAFIPILIPPKVKFCRI